MNEYLPENDQFVDDIVDSVVVHEAVDEQFIAIFGREPSDYEAEEFYQEMLGE